jgi:hypothetical protein
MLSYNRSVEAQMFMKPLYIGGNQTPNSVSPSEGSTKISIQPFLSSCYCFPLRSLECVI